MSLGLFSKLVVCPVAFGVTRVLNGLPKIGEFGRIQSDTGTGNVVV